MKNKVAVIDYWSDYNRGDAMMQVAILQLIDQWPASVALDSGVNEYVRFSKQLDETIKTGEIRFLPSPKLSFYFREPGKINNAINKAVLLLNIPLFHFFILIHVLGLNALLPGRLREFFEVIDNAEKIIWNGRNFRSNNRFFEFFEFFDLCCAAICSLYAGKKIYALGVSVWSPKTSAGKWLLKAVFSRCECVYAREDASLDLIKNEIMPEDQDLVGYLPDLSFYYMKNNLSESADLRESETLTISIVPKDPVRRNSVSLESYVQFIVEIAKNIVKQKGEGKKIRFMFVNQAVLENEPNDDAVYLIEKELSSIGEIVQPIRQPSLNDLSEAYRRSDFVISSRMHGCIMSSYLGRPFIGIPYDSGAKWNILERLGPCVLLPMEKIPDKNHDILQMIRDSEVYKPAVKMNQEAEDIVRIIKVIKELA